MDKEAIGLSSIQQFFIYVRFLIIKQLYVYALQSIEMFQLVKFICRNFPCLAGLLLLLEFFYIYKALYHMSTVVCNID